MSKYVKITNGLTYKIPNDEDEIYIATDKIKPTNEWKKITNGIDKDGYEQFQNTYETETVNGNITFEVIITSTLDGIEIDDPVITKYPKDVEIINNISCKLEEEDDY